MKKFFATLSLLFLLTACNTSSGIDNPSLPYPFSSPSHADLSVQVITERGMGTGTFIYYNGETYILTAGHVVDGTSAAGFNLDGNFYPAISSKHIFDRTGLNYSEDIAILKLEPEFAESGVGLRLAKNKIKRGEAVTVKAYPLGIYSKDYQFVSHGEFAGTAEGVFIYNLICTSGCSGAAYVSDKNEIVDILVRGSTRLNNLSMGVGLKALREALPFLTK